LGGGAIGLLSACVLREYGAEHVWVAETNANRRGLLEAATGATAYDPAGGHGPVAGSCGLVVDAVGSGRTRQAASALAASGSAIVHIGLQDNLSGLDTRRLTLQEISFIGTYCYTREDFAESLRLLVDGKVSETGWSEVRELKDGAKGFEDIHCGIAPPKIILSTNV
jgi:threonine dehydrogenase-like Zn-dependent dehydrogenase